MSGRRFFDTNVLGYMFDRDAPEKQELARDLLDSSYGEAVLSTQVLQELYVTVTRKLAEPLPQEEALGVLKDLAELTVVPLYVPMILEAAELSIRHQISLWDALILVAASSASCSVVLTEDLQDGWEVIGLRVENPFRDLR